MLNLNLPFHHVDSHCIVFINDQGQSSRLVRADNSGGTKHSLLMLPGNRLHVDAHASRQHVHQVAGVGYVLPENDA